MKKENNTEKLVVSFEDSMKADVSDTLCELAEVGLDSIMDDGILKEIPLLSTVVGVYKIGCTIKERHTIKQLALFITELNKGCVDEQKRKKLLEVINEDIHRSKQELEYLLVVLDSYLEYEKPPMLAKLYVAYLERSISWRKLAEYASMMNQLVPDDIELLKEKHHVRKQSQSRDLLRLTALGLMYEQDSPNFPDGDNDTVKDDVTSFSVTEFGQKFFDIVR